MKLFKRTILVVVSIFYMTNISAMPISPIDSTEGWPPLHQAIVNQQFDTALDILSANPSTIAQTTPDFKSDWVLGYLKNRKFESPKIGYTVLELAILYDAPIEFIEILIEFGANANSRNLFFFYQKPIERLDYFTGIQIISPLLAAVEKNNEEVIQILLNAGANPDRVELIGYFYFNSGDFGGYITGADGTWKGLSELLNEQINRD